MLRDWDQQSACCNVANKPYICNSNREGYVVTAMGRVGTVPRSARCASLRYRFSNALANRCLRDLDGIYSFD
jgi:hypothetical protein